MATNLETQHKAPHVVSRQRKWQLKQQANGKCTICGAVAVNKSHCEIHRKKERDRYTPVGNGQNQKYHCSNCGEAGHSKRVCQKSEINQQGGDYYGHILELRQSGLSTKQIGEIVGRSQNMISVILISMGYRSSKIRSDSKNALALV